MSECASEGWKAVPLADLASFRTGPFGSTFHKSDYRSGGVPLINPSHIIDGEIVPDEQVAVAPELASSLSVFALRENDIVIGRRGDMGRCAVVRSHQAGFLCGTGSMIVRPRSGVSPELLQAFLASPRAIAKIEENSVGTTMINLNQGTLSSLEILLPDNERGQQAIAAALSDADGVVAGLERVIAKKRLIKQGAMQDLLTARRRLAGWGDPTSEHVKVPKGWINVALSMLADFRTGPFGSTFHKSDYKRGGVPLINPSHIVDGEIIPDEAIAVSPDLAHKLSVFALQENDIVIGRRGEMGRCAVVTNQHVGFLCGTGSMIVRPKENGNSQLLRAYLASRAVIEKIEESSVGTTMINLNQTTLSSLELMVPEEPKEQQAIAAVLSDMDAEIQTLESRLTKARAIKEGMMQNLLTGRVRLV
ncbi:type I restriction enzyme S subunit [Roseinatronobacter monicus]|uniref:Type I restriction enzyme S subunit n=1 Tax=Roseinatronobacter monicus TaxID=393481 RepID=A0A543KG78_9RHOB|nr:type I restriction enzyme S subunit [Roseinatronobacter monicus]